MKLREGNVFTCVCRVCPWGGGGSPCDHYPWCIGPHCTGPPMPTPRHKTWGPPMAHPTVGKWDQRTPHTWPLLVTFGRQPLETCSNLFIRPHCAGSPNVTAGGRSMSYGGRKRAIRTLLECFLVKIIFAVTVVIIYLGPVCRHFIAANAIVLNFGYQLTSPSPWFECSYYYYCVFCCLNSWKLKESVTGTLITVIICTPFRLLLGSHKSTSRGNCGTDADHIPGDPTSSADTSNQPLPQVSTHDGRCLIARKRSEAKQRCQQQQQQWRNAHGVSNGNHGDQLQQQWRWRRWRFRDHAATEQRSTPSATADTTSGAHKEPNQPQQQ